MFLFIFSFVSTGVQQFDQFCSLRSICSQVSADCKERRSQALMLEILEREELPFLCVHNHQNDKISQILSFPVEDDIY